MMMDHQELVIKIDFVTIASTGNALDFGDLGCWWKQKIGGGSSPTRGVMVWWWTPGSQ